MGNDTRVTEHLQSRWGGWPKLVRREGREKAGSIGNREVVQVAVVPSRRLGAAQITPGGVEDDASRERDGDVLAMEEDAWNANALEGKKGL